MKPGIALFIASLAISLSKILPPDMPDAYYGDWNLTSGDFPLISENEGLIKFYINSQNQLKFSIRDGYWLNDKTHTLILTNLTYCLLYTSPSPRDRQKSRMPSSA